MGVPTPAFAFTNIKINGEEWGLYFAVEVIEEEFIERNYGSLSGNLYKPEGNEIDAKDNENMKPNINNGENNAPPNMNNEQNKENNAPPNMDNTQNGENIVPPNMNNTQNGENIAPPNMDNTQNGENIAPPNMDNTQNGENITPPNMSNVQNEENAPPTSIDNEEILVLMKLIMLKEMKTLKITVLEVE